MKLATLSKISAGLFAVFLAALLAFVPRSPAQVGSRSSCPGWPARPHEPRSSSPRRSRIERMHASRSLSLKGLTK